MRGASRLGAAVVAVAVAAALSPAAASAATATSAASNLFYTAAAGETNNLTISRDGAVYRLADPGAAITPTAPCAAVTANQVTCPVAGVTNIGASLGNMNDFGTVADSVTAPLNVGIFGEAGSDTLTCGANVGCGFNGDGGADPPATDVLTGGPQNDQLSGNQGNDVIDGAGGNDGLTGGPGDDQVTGGPGNDIMQSDATPDGTDTYTGGPGFDLLFYTSRTAAVRITADGVADDGEAGEGDNVMPDIEQFFTGPGNDVVVGGPGPTTIFSGGGNDQIDGADGNDIVNGADGMDTVLGGPGHDQLAGSLDADVVDGGEGDDSISAGDNDLAPDVFNGGAGTDVVDYSGAQDGVTVSLDGVAGDGVAGEGDNAMPDIEDVVGSPAADTLTGSAAANELTGGDGGDTISGLAGPDGLLGGRGDDSIDGGADTDLISGGDGADSLRSRDGRPDEVACGGGVDSVLFDDTDIAHADCDQLSSGVVFVAVNGELSKGGDTTIKLACPAIEGVACAGKLKLVSVGPRNVTLAKKSYSIPSGGTATVKLSLSAEGRKAIGERARTPAVASAKMTDATGALVVSERRLTLRQGGQR